jgi:hypothetical protein
MCQRNMWPQASKLGVGEDVSSGRHPVNRRFYALKQALPCTGLEGGGPKRSSAQPLLATGLTALVVQNRLFCHS